MAVPEVTDAVRQLALRMIELMRQADGIGLAATQVGVPWRLFVAFVPPGEGRSPRHTPPTAMVEPEVYINPVLSDFQGSPEPAEEGCLSLPGVTGVVYRAPVVAITATDLQGQRFSRRGAGLLARCWQHEYDHLDGVLILDRMTHASRLRVRPAVRRLERSGAL